MKAVFSIALIGGFLAASAQAAEVPDPATLRARAALALVFAAPPGPPSYAEGYTRAVREGKPLVVFVGQPVREVSGCVCVGLDTFPGAGAVAVVVGVPGPRGLRRHDLPGRPTDATIRAVASSMPAGTVLLPMGW
jgi:hypothetical protein